jgi:hypothetical protein
LVSSSGTLRQWGKAEEPRYQLAWRFMADNGGILEQVQEERPNALELCLARAWQEAVAAKSETTLLSTDDVEIGHGSAAVGLAAPGLVNLKLAAAALSMSISWNGAKGI